MNCVATNGGGTAQREGRFELKPERGEMERSRKRKLKPP